MQTDPPEAAQAPLSPQESQMDVPAPGASNGREASREGVLPVDSLREAAPYLRRPFDLYAVQFRALEGSGGKTLNCAAYVTARTVTDRLNLVCPGHWEDAYEIVPGGLRCDLTIDGLTRRDVGWAAATNTAMGLKALYSDAFKRAAVKFGVGVSLYALPRLALEVARQHAWAKAIPGKTDNYGNPLYKYGITANGMLELNARYERWLDEQESFGTALSHGHVEGSADPEDETLAAEDAEGMPLATEGDIKTLKEAAKGLLWRDVRMCFVAAGVPAPEKAKDCFVSVGHEAVAGLAKELKGAPRRAGTA
jgi:hypothetical protein